MTGKYRSLSSGLLGLVVASASLAWSAPGHAQDSPVIEFKQVWSTTGAGELGVKPEIVVSGSNGRNYDRVETTNIDLWFSFKLFDLSGWQRIDKVEISAEGRTMPVEGVGFSPKLYKFSFPYADPHASSVVNQRNSPIKTCNDRLQSVPSGSRLAFLRDGARIELAKAYPVVGRVTERWTTTEKDGIFDKLVDHHRTHEDKIDARVVIVCQPLGVPQRTTGAPLRTPVAPVISAASLRIEPAQVIEVDGQLCPSQLRLYGQIQAARKFEDGKAVIFGPGFLSPVTPLNFPHGGNRTITATYPLSWNMAGGLTSGPATANKSQTVNLTMNIATKTDAVIEQVKETITVTCKSIAVVNPQAIGSVAGKPQSTGSDPDRPVIAGSLPNPAVPKLQPGRLAIEPFWSRPDVGEPRPVMVQRTAASGSFVRRAAGATLSGVDGSIRLVDRKGPGGATRLFVRNAGDTAGQCRVYVRRESHDKWILIESMSSPAGRNSTVEVVAALPRDPGLRFAVDCDGEPDDRLDDNLASLP